MTIRDSNTEVFPPNQFAALPPTSRLSLVVLLLHVCLLIHDGFRLSHQTPSSWKSETLSTTLPLCWIRPWLESITNTSLIVIENGILIYRKPLAGSNPTRAYNWSPRNFAISSLLPFILTLLADTSIHIGRYTAFVIYIIGLVCTPMWRKCVPHVRDALYRIQQKQNPTSLFTPIEALFLVLHVDMYISGRDIQDLRAWKHI